MKIETPEFIDARFFMKGEIPEGIDDVPRIAPHQIHGSEILYVDDENFAAYEHAEADGILLDTDKAGASLRFADCAPVMIWGKYWVMILHSGYKGTVLNISGRGLELVRKLYGDEAAINASAWIGPCIGRMNYCRDVSDEWTLRGTKSYHYDNFEERDGKIYFDLTEEIRSQLLEGGVVEEKIMLSGIDTFTDERCCSYRKGDIQERMMLYVRLLL